ncbi:HAD-IA family hydrolase [Kangiella shandongensis]|uniref:HAD-IA family hydrolase n=1 Tax=Kangiella shandongensis TaxID=2763258 RepID=UPI001CC1BE2F|nr:HAD-IA family hydrolase [Kangiella shandongensis]
MLTLETPLIVFDWDGTLMDSTGRIVSAMQTTARNLQLPVPTDDEVRSIIGLSLTKCYNRLFPEVDDHEWITEEYRFQYVEGDKTPSPVFDGVVEVLTKLKEDGYYLTVATGKARHGLDRVLKESQLSPFFDHTIASDEAQSKPHPEMLHSLLKKFALKPEQGVMVGDTSHDLNMAANAGMRGIGVSYGAHTIETLNSCKPMAIIHDIKDLL